jgi:hypothetical protein
MENLRRRFAIISALLSFLILLGMNESSRGQGQEVIFSATGDIPYGTSEVSVFEQQIANHNKYSPSQFLIHVGDIASSGQCSESNYAMVSNMMKGLAVPAYIVLGDNESADCNSALSGYNFYLQYFQSLEKNFCGAPFTELQSGRPENFAFTLDGVLFIGINLSYGGSSVQQQAANWVAQQFEAKASQVRAAVIFAHYPPGTYTVFTTPFRAAAANFAKPILFLHGHGHSWSTSYPFPETNIFRVQVNKGVSEDPIQVTVTTNTSSPATAFVIKRNPWSAKTIVNMPPCVIAGPDQNIAGAAVASLKGQASDDGDPAGSALSIAWSQVSGPGVATFGNVNTPVTSASFSANGVYVLRLTADDGQLQKSDDLTLIVNAIGGSEAPAISAFTPPIGIPGSAITISGNNFNGTMSVFFNGTSATAFTVNSNAEIVATVPAGATTGKIMIINATSAGFSADDFVVSGSGGNMKTFTFQPSDDAYVHSLTASTNYGSATQLRLDTNSASDVSDAYLKFNVTGMTGDLQSAKLRLHCTDGSSQGGSVYAVSNDYIDGSAPWIESGLRWTNAPAITGSALSTMGAISAGQTVELNVTAAITGDGTYSFAIHTTSSNASLHYSKEGATPPELVIQTLPPPPSIASFTPASGPATTEITITGSALNSAMVVAVNGTSAAFTVDSNTQIRATVPSGATTGKISISSVDGTGSSPENFTVLPPLAITSFTPASGPAATEVTIKGVRFTTTAAVAFNGKPANFAIDADTLVRAWVPAGATMGKINMINTFGSGSSATNFNVLAPPAVASFTPAHGPATTEVTINGNYFTGATGVSFNGNTAASIIVDSDTKIRAVVPNGATASTGKIVVANALGNGASAANFTIDPSSTFTFAPKHDAYVKSTSPTTTNGTASTLRGRTSASEVMQSYLKFDITGMTGTLHSAKLRLYVSDASTDGGAVYLTSSNYKSSPTPWLESGLHWDNAPVITGAPLSSAGAVSIGQWVELNVAAAIVGNGTYSFGLKNNVSDQVYYRAKENGAATAPQLMIITTPSNAPNLTSFTPGDGPVDTEVTIKGNNFIGAGAVTFNGVVANFALDSDTQIRARVPAGATSGKIRITNASGSGSYATDFIVTETPAIASFTPGTGPVKAEVTITGSHFTGVTSVQFNGSPSTSVIIDSETQIRAVVPANAAPGAGKIVVTNSAGSATSTNDFVIIPPPIILLPKHDAYVSSSAPATKYGTASAMRTKTSASETFISYLKFDVAGVSSAPVSAKLRLYVTNSSPDGGAVYLVSNDYLNTATPWLESGMLWTNAPAITGTPLSAIGTATSSQWVEVEVTPAITGNGTYSFAIKNNNSDAVYYATKESSNDPQLVIQMPSGASTAAKRGADEAALASAIPAEFVLEQNYPNPFNPSTQIRFGLPQASHVAIKVYTINGAEVRALVDREFDAGTHTVTFHAQNLPSGTYFYVMQAGGVRQVRQLMLVK